jgi:hypothetical protein
MFITSLYFVVSALGLSYGVTLLRRNKEESFFNEILTRSCIFIWGASLILNFLEILILTIGGM